MAVLKCKMCGGDLNVVADTTVVECEYCGTKQTVSKTRDEIVNNLFNRANNLRLKCEFDKAEQVYEKILDIDNTDSEAHWGLVLCKYGIEYVEDPKTYSRVPTCHRTLFESVISDNDYLLAIKNADQEQKTLYIKEAQYINELQKNILNIVQNEKPFDIFLCYKETDADGRRTLDSGITNDIYYQLIQEGFKVFYAPITLEDKLGQEYEPYIFAALNTAKVMLVIGTKPEYFDAVWVRNEWSRFLKIIKNDRSKLLIPCYRDMDAYELPNEFAHLQAQDMSKIGFISDVVRGVKRIIDLNESPPKVVPQKYIVSEKNNSIEETYKKTVQAGKYFLKEKKWSKARRHFSEALKIDADSFEANLGILFCKLKVSSFFQTPKCTQIPKLKEYKFALETANSQEKEKLTIWLKEKSQNIEELKLKKQTIVNKVVKIISIMIYALLIVIFVVIPSSNYIKYSSLLKAGKTEEAAISFYSSESIQYDFLINRLFEKYGDIYLNKSDYVNAYNCYRYLLEDKHEERLYNIGCKLVESKQYDIAADCFLQIYEYKNSKDYYNYCKGNQLLLENDINSYDYFSNCKNFSDTEKIIKKTSWLNNIDFLQGKWYYPGETREEYNQKMRQSGYYYEVNGTFYSKGYYKNYQELIDAIAENKGLFLQGMVISGPDQSNTITIKGIEKLKILDDGKIGYNQGLDEYIEIEIINESKIKMYDDIYKKQ